STASIDTVDNIIYTYSYTQSKRYSITGVVHFEYANWIEPRFIADIDSINVTSGIQEHPADLANLNIFPNPNDGAFTVSVDIQGEESSMNLILTDLCGRIVYQEKRSSHPGKMLWNVQTDGLDKGIYLMEISNSSSRTVQKIMVR
ncbi:MAG TPA: T9SS type A sorting domain-containing protein, partial [Bacteroidia bacterium]|nr:T9SS type A sorting domain-containing protein [Bacteroidia bacterium]